MICEKNKCTGCFACYNVCPKNAIEMVEDDNGFIYPKINEEKCINCKLCTKICPANNPVVFKEPIKCYAMQMKDNKKLSESTSGGAATLFSEYIINNGGVVYGAAFQKEFKINHIRIDSIEDLKKIKGSKYVHCYILDTFKMIKKDLMDERLVLFIGTPCQVAGLKKYLMKDYANLFCIDIICHGVPSQKYLKDELKKDTNINLIDSLKFRVGDEFKILAKKNNQVLVDKKMNNSRYYEGFMDAVFYRENCYSCVYAQNLRVSDMTIGDFWGLNSDSKLYSDRKKGMSVLLPVTNKGLQLIEECKEYMNLEQRDILEAINGNSQLQAPSHTFKKYDKFKELYIKYGFEKAYDTVCRNKIIKKYIKQKLKNNKLVYSLYKKLKEVKK